MFHLNYQETFVPIRSRKTSWPTIWSLSLSISIFISLALPAHAQSPVAGSEWHRVEALPIGTIVSVKDRTHAFRCRLASVTDDALTCTRGSSGVPVVTERTQVRRVQIDHRGRSALIGAGIGGGALAIAGFAITTNNQKGFFGSNFLRGPATGLGAGAGVLIGGGIGALTAFAKSTVYRAP